MIEQCDRTYRQLDYMQATDSEAEMQAASRVHLQTGCHLAACFASREVKLCCTAPQRGKVCSDATRPITGDRCCPQSPADFAYQN
jgi:hypothetical protein